MRVVKADDGLTRPLQPARIAQPADRPHPAAHIHERAVHPESAAEQGSQALVTTVA
jgi:hypothetical protein